MDPFAFDQMFARYVAQVDSHAMRRGTELYEAGAVTVRSVTKARVEGSVVDGRLGVFGVSLLDNQSGGFSGSCSCEEIFNCRHSYALARAARDRIMGPAGTSSSRTVKREKAAADSETIRLIEGRLGRMANQAERQLAVALDRLWQTLRGSGFLLYPRELAPFMNPGQSMRLSPREPLRELKRMLPKGGADNALELADALKCLCQYRNIEVNAALEQIADSTLSAARFAESKKASTDRSVEEKPLELTHAFRLEAAPEADWFHVSATPAIRGGNYSAEEIEALIAAQGQLTRLEGKGWRRLDMASAAEEESVLAALGLDAIRGNRQRIHVTQIEALIPDEGLDGPQWSEIRRRAQFLASAPEPEPPAFLNKVLRPYQLEGFRFLCRLTRFGFGGLLADDMGLGKTLQALAWLEWLKEEKEKPGLFRVLVVCPKSVMDNWLQEPAAFGCSLGSFLFRPGSESESGYKSANIVVANYTQLRLNAELFLSEEWDAAILDEGQYIKSPDSQTTKIAWRIPAKQRLILSGTPVENRLLDLWSLMRFAMPRLLGPRATFLSNYGLGKDVVALEGLRRRVRPFILRRLKSQVAAELPDRIEKELHCEMEQRQMELYRAELEAARNAFQTARESGELGADRFNVLTTILRLRQICCDPALVDPELRLESGHAPKVQALLDLLAPIREEGHKVLVFSQFVSLLDIVGKALKMDGISYLSLTGKTKNRAELVRRFQKEDEEAGVFLLSLKAAGSGLTLTAASYVVLLDPWWNPAVEAQAIDRTHRIGQRNQVIAYRIVMKDTVEEKIRQIQRNKGLLANSVVEGGALDEEILSEILRIED